MGITKTPVEKGNGNCTQHGDGPEAIKAKTKLLEVLTTEQTRIPRDHPDWIVLENMKEDIIKDDPRVLEKKLGHLAELYEVLTAETLTSETSK